MKILSPLYKILPVILLFFISTLPVQALSFPSTQPTGEISGGKFNQTLTNIFGDCGAGNYIQGFTSTGVADCKSAANFNTLTLAAGQSNATSGEGLFQKYLTKILNDCGTGRYVRGFNSNKNLICEDTAQTVTLMGTTTSLVSPVVTVTLPPPPVGQSPGGTFTDSFNTLFAADCGAGKYLQGFDASKNKICGSIVTTIAISDCTQLQNIGTNATTLSGSYHLTNDIDCSTTNPSNSANALSIWNNGGLGFKPIGSSPLSFSGTLDGAGYKITGLYIHRPSETNVGLFGSTNGATIKNIGIDGANIKGGPTAGGLVGDNYFSPISHSYVTNSISIDSWNMLGGLVGRNRNSPISNSYTNRNTIGVSGSSFGGLVGDNYFSPISNSYSIDNTINGSSSLGGFIGWNNSSPISNSYATNNAINGTSSLGGLVGDNLSSSITYSYATNNTINGSSSLGGLVGDNFSSSLINNSAATNNAINGSSGVGGLVGDNNGPVSNSYATNNAINGSSSVGGLIGGGGPSTLSISNSYATDNTVHGNGRGVGGLVGYNVSLSIINSYAANKTVIGLSTDVGGLVGYNGASLVISSSDYNKDTFTGATSYGSGKTTAEMIIQGTYTGWDFSSATKDWKPMSALTGYYPCLAWQNVSTCTKAPGVITNCTELQNIGTSTGALAGKYQLASDIDCSVTTSWNSGLGFKPIGDATTPFKGVLDGKGYKITGLYINRPLEGYVGLIGKANATSIKNLGIDGAIITGQWYVGGLVGYIDGSNLENIYINNSQIEGVGNTQSIGGMAAITYTTNIVGSNIKNSTIKTMSSSSIAGGLIGFNNNSPVSTSYTKSINVKGGLSIGGLIGYNNYGLSTISDSYSTKNIVTGGGGYDVGGLIGFNNNAALLSNSFASFNNVTGMDSVGGLIGMNINVVSTKDSYANNNTVNGTSSVGGFIGSNYYFAINNSYANNNTVNGTSSVGGFIGYIVGTAVNNSYSANNIVTGTTKIGGFIGENPNAPISSSYYSKDTFTGATLYGSGKTTGEMIVQGTYTGWDFSADWKPMGTLVGYYPCLAWQSVESCVKPPATSCTTGMTEITLANGQTWSCMNLGATTVWDGLMQPTDCVLSTTNCNNSLTWLGNYYQWGRNDTGFTPTTWIAVDTAWGGSLSDTATADGVGTTAIGRQGPCATGWHVPSAKDMQDMCNQVTGTTCTYGMAYNPAIQSVLKLPFAGAIRFDGLYMNQSAIAWYWSSSPKPTNSYDLSFYSGIFPMAYSTRVSGFGVRCLKN